MAKKKHIKKKQPHLLRPALKLTENHLKALFALSLIVLISFAFGFLFLSSSRLPPSSYLGEENLSFKSIGTARAIILREVSDFDRREIIFEAGEKFLPSTFADIGINVDLENSLDVPNNYVFSFKKPLFLSLSILNPFYRKKLNVVYNLDSVKLGKFLETLARDYEVKPTDANIVNSKDGFVAVNEQMGEEINVGLLVSDIKQRVENVSVSPIRVKKISKEPKVKIGGTEEALSTLKKLVDHEIVFKYKEDSWKLGGAEIVNLTELYPRGRKSGYIFLLGSFSFPVIIEDTSLSEKSLELVVGVNESGFDSYFGSIAKSVNRPRVDATMLFEDGKITNFKPAVDGQKMDTNAAKKYFIDIFSASDNAGLTTVIDLPVVVDRAQIANSDVSSLGIREHLSSGVSYFRGSIPNRIFNVGLGALRVSGTIVSPDEIFSFNDAIGEVSGSTGYKQAYVISEGRTVLDDGGGICQVSTTVYRAALNAGLPIVARTAHAYRVSYYEQGGYGPGLDATVWSPSVDLKFKNDTGHHVLVQAIVNPASSKLQVDIYGTRDDRRVEISKPVVSNVKIAPPDKFQDDPTLPKGSKKQVDFAASGATSVFTRKVYSGDKLIIDETIKSIYRPWQAIFLVGTG